MRNDYSHVPQECHKEDGVIYTLLFDRKTGLERIKMKTRQQIVDYSYADGVECHKEDGVIYTFDRKAGLELHKKPFEYVIYHADTPNSPMVGVGQNVVYCNREIDFLRLINHWNSQHSSYKYVALKG
jgi:hypothetical protein